MVGIFPDGKSAVVLVAVRHVAGTCWGKRVDLDMERLGASSELPHLGLVSDPASSRDVDREQLHRCKRIYQQCTVRLTWCN